MGMLQGCLRRIPPIEFFLVEIEWLVHTEGASTRLTVALCGGLSEVYGHDGPGVCLGNGQTEACLKYGHDGPGVCLGDGQTEAYLKDMDMKGLASAWAMARRRPI